jgi:hypothetical protein
MGNKAKNKSRTFEIPKEMISTFFTNLEETELEYELKEVDEDGDLVIEIDYSENEKGEVMDLIELLDEYYNQNEEESEEEDN